MKQKELNFLFSIPDNYYKIWLARILGFESDTYLAKNIFYLILKNLKPSFDRRLSS